RPETGSRTAAQGRTESPDHVPPVPPPAYVRWSRRKPSNVRTVTTPDGGYHLRSPKKAGPRLTLRHHPKCCRGQARNTPGADQSLPPWFSAAGTMYNKFCCLSPSVGW